MLQFRQEMELAESKQFDVCGLNDTFLRRTKWALPCADIASAKPVRRAESTSKAA